jgi:hypothetical protein
MASVLEPLVDRAHSTGSAVRCVTRLISGSATFITALFFFWIVLGIGAARSAPCPPGTVPATPPLSGCLVLAPCASGQVTPSGMCCPSGTTAQADNTCLANTPPPQQACTASEMPGPNGTCVCFSGNPPGPSGSCPILHICLSQQTCCPQGEAATNAGTCCPQGQVPLSDGSCANLSPTLARMMANQGLCPLSEELQPDGTCVFNNTLGLGPACTGFPPLPQTVYEGPCCTPGQVPAQKNHQYTGTCCPVGQVPDQNTGSCAPQESFINNCPGGGQYNAKTSSCCPPGSLITNRYTCCPPGQYPQPSGSCGCPWTAMQQSDGSCMPLCPTDSIPTGIYCTNCPTGQIGTVAGVCCAPNQIASNGFCCPSNFHPQGAYCMPNTNLNRAPDDCPPGQVRRGDGTCDLNPPVETPGLIVEPKVPGRSDNPIACGNGLVPREAFRGDRVCVAQAAHDQTIADNIAAPSRTLPNGLCVRGYLWRRANPDDHVCVLPATREQTQSDNRQCADGRCEVPVSGAAGTTGGSTVVSVATGQIPNPVCPPGSKLAGQFGCVQPSACPPGQQGTASCCPPGYWYGSGDVGGYQNYCFGGKPTCASPYVLTEGTYGSDQPWKFECCAAGQVTQGSRVGHGHTYCCPSNQVPLASGTCCAASQVTSRGTCCPTGQNPQDGTCKMTQPVKTPGTPGLTPPPPPLPSSPVPSRLCSSGETMLPDGDCCPSGQVTSRGTCCTLPYEPADDGTCKRPPQQRPGDLLVQPQPNVPVVCASPSVLRDGRCVVPDTTSSRSTERRKPRRDDHKLRGRKSHPSGGRTSDQDSGPPAAGGIPLVMPGFGGFGGRGGGLGAGGGFGRR